MHNKVLILLSCLILAGGCQKDIPRQENSQISYKNWDDQLKKFVSQEGWVDYRGWLDQKDHLDQFLTQVSNNPPGKDWSASERLAYWINAYNAFTVQLILKHYPVKSIKDIGPALQIPFVSSVFDIKFIEIGNQKMDLNFIEHSILRKEFSEPRIHFAINCASVSCPKLLNEAYIPEKLEQQLDMQTIHFINDPEKNEISKDEIRISKIFKWFTGDFKQQGKSLVAFLNQYSEKKIESDAVINYMDYNWALNGKASKPSITN